MSCRSLRINPTSIVREAATYRVGCAHFPFHLVEVLNVEAGSDVRVRFAFEAKGLDKKSKPGGDRVSGSAVAVIDVYDHVVLPYKKW
jgi:hypothetical protein